MPELPEVEHVVRSLRRSIVGSRIVATEVTLPKLIAPSSSSAFNRKIKGSQITAINRRGKYILIELEGPKVATAKLRRKPGHTDLILAVHLRMTGQFLVLKPDDSLPRHAHAVFYLDDERRLVFRDQRQFGVMKLVSQSELTETKGIRELAPEPFSEEFSLSYLREILGRSKRTLKTLLLDQTRVLGLGNIYAAEALFRAGINPFTTASALSTRRISKLHTAIRDVLRAAVSGNSARRLNLEDPNGFSYGEAFGKVWQVYEREGEPCYKCGTRIRRLTHGGRSTYWCPTCQRR
ncbi:MAG TPA: bifunctional DNA-formamidopyrimidine glycosylase/DNA-(apurinic or apyrimidinic site) lyase [Pyrinomonadaceae bacterium]|nr:bifunctional DNA-formamidopyrimidine glycosylase/DNA-(apurinic or apyrimidinic site) lyase [Pyrinomonadaceae bacterium]